MKKLFVLLLMFASLSISSCVHVPELSDFCGQSAISSRSIDGFYLSFEKQKGAGITTVRVTVDEYDVYKNGKPINCK